MLSENLRFSVFINYDRTIKVSNWNLTNKLSAIYSFDQWALKFQLKIVIINAPGFSSKILETSQKPVVYA